jgi:hypothetical protein
MMGTTGQNILVRRDQFETSAIRHQKGTPPRRWPLKLWRNLWPMTRMRLAEQPV